MIATDTDGWPVHFAGNSVRFTSNHSGVRKAVETHFRFCSGISGPVIADYKITTTNDTDFSVSVDGSVLFSTITFEQVLWYLMQDCITRLNSASQLELVFHAAALSKRDRGLILCGQSGCGKSSLTTRLVTDGWKYLTDEVIALPIDAGKISGFCRSIVLKPGSSFLWQRLLGQVELTDGLLRFKNNSIWITPTLLNNSAVRATVVPRMLVFPQYGPETQFKPKRLGSAEALFRLLQCLVNARNFTDSGMGATTHLARQVSAYSLEYSELEDAAQWINQTIPTA